ncbi:HYC_CC_PP family protein [Costertonia aggregata]|uniref:Uncharacterized protein n=1 Tax=Costertonia aggregata TaxID=343403 RepID=A0A7H9AQU8_9FLAO|nr:hypothetical protein [Costertonia aggregata]QLG45813.1 hypothetical protein HYG79_10780 [Costertonia aggregata]
MKHYIHKIFSLFMALLLLVSTTSWKVEKHYCMGHLIDVAVFSEPDSCSMLMSSSETKDSKENTIEKGCCDNEIEVVEGQDTLKNTFEDLSLKKQQFLVALSSAFIHVFYFETESSVSDNIYPPPILVKDIQLLDEVFLI